MRIWRRLVSTYSREGAGGRRLDYHKMEVPREVYSREIFLAKYGSGFIAFPSLEEVKRYGYLGFWYGGRLFLPDFVESPDFAVCVGSAGPYLIYRVDKFSLWRSRRSARGILRKLRELADGIPEAVERRIREVKEREGKVKLFRRGRALCIELTDEEVREEIEAILKGLWRSKRRGILRGNIYDVRLKLIRHGYLPLCDFPVEEEETLPRFGLKYEMRDYQRAILRDFLRQGASTITLPHGAGKTAIALKAIGEIRGRTLVVVPTKNLLSQWYDKFFRETTLKPYQVRRLVGILGGGREEVKEITITTYKSFHKVAHREWSLIVADESHRLPAETFAPLASVPHKYFMGLTGTPYRASDRETEMIYALGGPPDRFGKLWTYFFRERYIFKPTVYILRVPFVNRMMKEKYERADGFERIRIAARNPVKLRHLDYLISKHRKVLIFCEWVDIAERIARKMGCPLMNGRTSLRQREAIARWLKEERRGVVVATKCAEEGVDLPDLDCVIDVAFWGGTPRQPLQRLGRLMRMVERKKMAGYYYIVTRDTVEEEFLRERLAVIEEKGIPVIELGE